MDMNDRALREIVRSLGGAANGYPREEGFDITVASEMMAILCLATSLADLEGASGQIVVGIQARPGAGAREGLQGAGRNDGVAQGRAHA